MATHDADRRQIIGAGLAFFGILVVLIVLTVVLSGDAGDERTTSGSTVACATDDTVCLAAQADSERPSIIPQPGSGHAPRSSGDPGGWGQIGVFVGLVVALAVIGLLVVRSIRKARAAPTG